MRIGPAACSLGASMADGETTICVGQTVKQPAASGNIRLPLARVSPLITARSVN